MPPIQFNRRRFLSYSAAASLGAYSREFARSRRVLMARPIRFGSARLESAIAARPCCGLLELPGATFWPCATQIASIASAAKELSRRLAASVLIPTTIRANYSPAMISTPF